MKILFWISIPCSLATTLKPKQSLKYLRRIQNKANRIRILFKFFSHLNSLSQNFAIRDIRWTYCGLFTTGMVTSFTWIYIIFIHFMPSLIFTNNKRADLYSLASRYSTLLLYVGVAFLYIKHVHIKVQLRLILFYVDIAVNTGKVLCSTQLPPDLH